MSIARAIRVARENLGFTQEVLAERAEIPASYVLQIEKGEYNPTAKSLKRIARSLGLTVHQLMTMAISIEDKDDELKQLGKKLLLSVQPILIRKFLSRE